MSARRTTRCPRRAGVGHRLWGWSFRATDSRRADGPVRPGRVDHDVEQGDRWRFRRRRDEREGLSHRCPFGAGRSPPENLPNHFLSHAGRRLSDPRRARKESKAERLNRRSEPPWVTARRRPRMRHAAGGAAGRRRPGTSDSHTPPPAFVAERWGSAAWGPDDPLTLVSRNQPQRPL